MEMQDHTAFPDVRSPSISFISSAVKEKTGKLISVIFIKLTNKRED